MPIVGSMMREVPGVSEFEYVNDTFFYNIVSENWQVIRPSFLVFLNSVLPVHSTTDPEKTKILQIAEVGVAGGINAIIMLKAYKDTVLHLIDDYSQGQQPTPMLNLTKSYADRVKFTRKPSIEAAKDYPDNFFDYLYLDAAHDYKNVMLDLEAWYPKVKYLGMLAGHDWMLPQTEQGVRKAVVEFLQDGKPQRLYAIQNFFPENTHHGLDGSEGQATDWWFIKRKLVGKR